MFIVYVFTTASLVTWLWIFNTSPMILVIFRDSWHWSGEGLHAEYWSPDPTQSRSFPGFLLQVCMWPCTCMYLRLFISHQMNACYQHLRIINEIHYVTMFGPSQMNVFACVVLKIHKTKIDLIFSWLHWEWWNSHFSIIQTTVIHKFHSI